MVYDDVALLFIYDIIFLIGIAKLFYIFDRILLRSTIWISLNN